MVEVRSNARLRKISFTRGKEEFVKQLGADAKQRVIDLAENWEADAKDVAEFLIFQAGSQITASATRC